MKKQLLSIALCMASLLGYAQTNPNASFGATVYAQQSMTDNASPSYMVNWAALSNGATIENSQADIASHVTTLNIDASAISGTLSSISVYALGKEAIAGTLTFNGSEVCTPVGGSPSIYASNGQSDVVMVKDISDTKKCTAYLLPVALGNGVKVTVKTVDGKFYSQDFRDAISVGETKTLTITNTTANNLWMATIPGNTYFSFVSTPGSHDSLTKGTNFGSSAECQDMTLEEQLKAGVRCFDIRPGYYYTETITEDNLYIYHGQISTGILYKDAIKTLADFVKDNPTEALTIVMVKENCKPTISLKSWTDRSDEMWTVVKAIQERYKDYMKVLDHSYYTLDDFRGKICYVNRTGTPVQYSTQITNWPDDNTVSDYTCVVGLCNANVQDKYNSNGTTKQTAVKDMLQLSSNNTTFKNMHYNYCSSANSPKSYATSTNPAISTYLDGTISGPTGYVLADYIGSSNVKGGADLLTAIINQNYRYVYNGRYYQKNTVDTGNSLLDKDKGWQKVTNVKELGATGYYYVFADNSEKLMLSFEEGCNQSTDAAYKTMVYRTGEKAEMNPAMLWITESNAKGLNNFSIKSAVPGVDKYIQTEYNAAYYCRTHDNGGGNSGWYSWIFAYDENNGYWTIENGTYPSSSTATYKGFIGPWGDAQFVNGMQVAGNKEGANVGHFQIYRIPSDKVNWELFASEENPANYTFKIQNHSFEKGIVGWTNSVDNLIGSVTAPDFNNKVGSYCVENWWTAANNFDFSQSLSGLPSGRYELKALAINAKGGDAYIYAGDGETEITKTNAPAELYSVMVFVNDGNLTIGLKGNKPAQSWVAADNFELFYLGSVPSITRSTKTNKYGTICAPFVANVEGAKIYSASLNAAKTAVELTEVTSTTAGVPYIYQATADAQTFSYKEGSVVLNPVTDDILTGVFKPTAVPVGAYVMQTKGDVQKFYVVADGKQPTLSKYKAYLTVPTADVKAFNIGTAEETAIKALDALTSGDAKIYDLNGRELKSLQKGVNIVNGVKVMVK